MEMLPLRTGLVNSLTLVEVVCLVLTTAIKTYETASFQGIAEILDDTISCDVVVNYLLNHRESNCV